MKKVGKKILSSFLAVLMLFGSFSGTISAFATVSEETGASGKYYNFYDKETSTDYVMDGTTNTGVYYKNNSQGKPIGYNSTDLADTNSTIGGIKVFRANNANAAYKANSAYNSKWYLINSNGNASNKTSVSLNNDGLMTKLVDGEMKGIDDVKERLTDAINANGNSVLAKDDGSGTVDENKINTVISNIRSTCGDGWYGFYKVDSLTNGQTLLRVKNVRWINSDTGECKLMDYTISYQWAGNQRTADSTDKGQSNPTLAVGINKSTGYPIFAIAGCGAVKFKLNFYEPGSTEENSKPITLAGLNYTIGDIDCGQAFRIQTNNIAEVYTTDKVDSENKKVKSNIYLFSKEATIDNDEAKEVGLTVIDGNQTAVSDDTLFKNKIGFATTDSTYLNFTMSSNESHIVDGSDTGSYAGGNGTWSFFSMAASNINDEEQYGDLKVNKKLRSANGKEKNLAGVEFDLYDKSTGVRVGSGSTNKNGNLYFCNFPVGEYRLFEILPADTDYIPDTSNATGVNADGIAYWDITIQSDGRKGHRLKNQVVSNGSDVDVTQIDSDGNEVNVPLFNNGNNQAAIQEVINLPKRGNLYIYKHDEFGTAMADVTFTLYDGNGAIAQGTTGSTGQLAFCDVPVGKNVKKLPVQVILMITVSAG